MWRTPALLNIAVRPSGEPLRVPYDTTRDHRVITRLRQLRPTRIVLEATGGMERPLVRALVEAALPVIVVYPLQVRDFAKATGRRQRIRGCAGIGPFWRGHPARGTGPPRSPDRGLAALLARRRQVLAMQHAEQMRLDRTAPPVHKRIRVHLRWLPPNWLDSIRTSTRG